MKILFSVLLIAAIGNGCASSPEPPKANSATPIPARSPDAKVEQQASTRREEQRKAIDDFVRTNFPGWKLEGFGNAFSDCDMDIPCNLHLTNGKKTRVIAVMVQSFDRPDGSKYWLAFEARPIDLSQQRKVTIEDAMREQVLADLDIDSCQSVIEANIDDIVASHVSTMDIDYEPGPSRFDPRDH